MRQIILMTDLQPPPDSQGLPIALALGQGGLTVWLFLLGLLAFAHGVVWLRGILIGQMKTGYEVRWLRAGRARGGGGGVGRGGQGRGGQAHPLRPQHSTQIRFPEDSDNLNLVS